MTVLACHLAPCSVMGPRKDENARGPLVRRRPGALDGVRVCVCRGKETRAWEREGGETFARKVQAVLLAGAVSLASASGAQAGAIGASHIWGSERDRPILDARNVIPVRLLLALMSRRLRASGSQVAQESASSTFDWPLP